MPNWNTYNDFIDEVSDPSLPPDEQPCEPAVTFARQWGHFPVEEGVRRMIVQGSHPDLHTWLQWAFIKHRKYGITRTHAWYYIRGIIEKAPRPRPILRRILRRFGAQFTDEERSKIRQAIADNVDRRVNPPPPEVIR